MKRYELVEWPPYPYGVVAFGLPIFSVFDRQADRHVYWTKNRQEAVDHMDRLYNG